MKKELAFQREREGKALVLAPQMPLPIKRTEKDPEKLKLVHKMGYDLAKREMDKIRLFLGQ